MKRNLNVLKIGDTVYVCGQEGYRCLGIYFLIKTKVRSITNDPDPFTYRGNAYRLENGRQIDDKNFGKCWWQNKEEGLKVVKERNKAYKEKLLKEFEMDLNKLIEKKAYWETVYVDTAYVKEDHNEGDRSN